VFLMVLVGFPRELTEEGGQLVLLFVFLGEFIGQLEVVWAGELPVM
jgi:hypothetical protein